MEEVLVEVTSKHRKDKKSDHDSLHGFTKRKLQQTNLTYEMTTFQYLKGAYQELERDSSAAAVIGQGVTDTN